MNTGILIIALLALGIALIITSILFGKVVHQVFTHMQIALAAGALSGALTLYTNNLIFLTLILVALAGIVIFYAIRDCRYKAGPRRSTRTMERQTVREAVLLLKQNA